MMQGSECLEKEFGVIGGADAFKHVQARAVSLASASEHCQLTLDLAVPQAVLMSCNLLTDCTWHAASRKESGGAVGNAVLKWIRQAHLSIQD